MSTVINAETPQSTQQASVCSNIHDLTGIRTSDPATWPDYGVKSLVRGPQCSLSRDAVLHRDALKGSCVRWRIQKLMTVTDMWIASPTEGRSEYANSFRGAVEAMNVEIARRKRSEDLGR